eukprot:gnl/TRDRNA2_/TRDRNA2_180564_c0_seq1.p1 gnl/TRDRNA2_/TRDRNA2_180564_c0~~gnl/TRDRNA2_/TRDRNA2_180564_c0_seq1.p1  ORF type:complete len:297 (+),score=49.43 gnl/TRDRNA2_/TRDRNA2_180564_c0_seq1:84-974(+)
MIVQPARWAAIVGLYFGVLVRSGADESEVALDTDEVALLQQRSVRLSANQSESALQLVARAAWFARASGEHSRSQQQSLFEAQPSPGFECTKYPMLCKAPFNCHRLTFLDKANMMFKMTTSSGHPNPQVWCLGPALKFYHSVVERCLVHHDLQESARVQQAEAIDTVDASYCFLEGHCANTDVTELSSIKEAELACDRKYGHQQWTSVSIGDFAWAAWHTAWHATEVAIPLAQHIDRDDDKLAGMAAAPEVSHAMGRLACAMGNFHCDVHYCKATYCRDPKYFEMFSHMFPDPETR